MDYWEFHVDDQDIGSHRHILHGKGRLAGCFAGSKFTERMEKDMKKILVVDDDEMNLKMAKFILEQKDYFVITASSGMECLSILKNRTVDLILLDVEMPIMNGIKTLECIRDNKELINIPVMFLTADANEATVIAAGRLDAAGYVKKPYMPQDFLERVEKIIG